MASPNKVSDLFPNLSRNELEQIYLGRDKKVFKEFAIKKRVTAFKVCIVSHRIVMQLMLNDWNRLTMANYINNALKSFELNPFQPEKCIWETIEKKLSKCVFKDQNKNSDIRTCYRIDNNKFLVKSSFTFGQRTVEKGTVHFVQTTTVPMLFYSLDEKRNTHREPCIRESCFLARDEMCYNKFVLQPNTLYEIPSKTVYVLIAVQKTLFSLHVTLQNSGLACGESPFMHKKFITNPYALIPQTPIPVGRNLHFEEPTTSVQPKYVGVFQLNDYNEEYSDPFTMPPPSTIRENISRTQEITPSVLDSLEFSPSVLDSLEIPPSVMDTRETYSHMLIREEDLLRSIPQNQNVQQQIVFVVNPTRLVRGTYDYPKPEEPPLWKELDEVIKNKNILPNEICQVQPMDLSLNGMKGEFTIPFTPIHLDENAEIIPELHQLLKDFENECKDNLNT